MQTKPPKQKPGSLGFRVGTFPGAAHQVVFGSQCVDLLEELIEVLAQADISNERWDPDPPVSNTVTTNSTEHSWQMDTNGVEQWDSWPAIARRAFH